MTRPTEQHIRRLRDNTVEFEEILNQHIQARNHYFEKRPEYPEYGEQGAEFDILGNSITIQWTKTDRCGDTGYYQREFPLSDLWDLGWERRAKRKRKARLARRRTERETVA